MHEPIFKEVAVQFSEARHAKINKDRAGVIEVQDVPQAQKRIINPF
jgi:hypothetical protein